METIKTPNKDKGAFACSDPSYLQDGITKREYFAAAALQGILSQEEMRKAMLKRDVASIVIEFADELLKQLEETKTE